MEPTFISACGRVQLYLADCLDVLPTLGRVDACVTDPQYGIDQANGMGGGGYDGFGNSAKRAPKSYEGDWDDERPSLACLRAVVGSAKKSIVWGGNYLADLLPRSTKWLFWDKQNTMPTYSDGEIAWTNLDGVSTKKFTYNGSGLMAKEKERVHPTQKPVELMLWCLRFVDDALIVVDPFMGSGTTGVAALRVGKTFIGIERDPQYYEIAKRRICAELAQRKMF